MMNKVVIDASVFGTWLLNETSGFEYAQSLMHKFEINKISLVVPALFFDEVLNILLKSLSSQRISEKEFEYLTKQLNKFHGLVSQIPYQNSLHDLEQKILLCRKFSLRSYDSNYLFLSIENKFHLATLDQRLIRAAKVLGCYYE